jgi:hypothetical protein
MLKRKTVATSRRRFVKSMALGASALASTTGFRVMASGLSPYAGKLLVTLELDGGADATQLCDPKVNMPGELKINNWADTADPGEAGNILFAPVADNFTFFNRFGADMVVVNGVDAQTNSHETGRLFNWTGSNAEGRPSLSALHAAANSPDQPLAYSVYGGNTARTAGLLSYNRFSDISVLRELATPHLNWWGDGGLARPEPEILEAQRLTGESVSALLASADLTPRQRKSLTTFQSARAGREGLEKLAESLPNQDELQQREEFLAGDDMFGSNLKQQMQAALTVMQSGLGSSADLSLGGFDSHDNHDAIHDALYTHLADAITFFWDYAEKLGLADRILLVVGSDFGRTNMYNDGNGKDHWPIGSYMLMEQGARWGNRVVGASDELHFARRINPGSLEVSDSGIVVTPAHIHRAVQQYLGLDDFAAQNGVGIQNVEDIPLFSSSLQTRV